MCWTWIVMSGGTLSSANSVFVSLVFLWLFSSNWFPMLFYASCLTFTIFSQAVLSNKKSFQQERLCIMRLLFTKAASGWHEPNPPPALSAQPYCNTIWNSCLSWIWCFLSVEACCLFCISLHTIWAICLPLTSFRVNMTHLSLSCPSTRNWNTISFYFSAKSIAFLLCRSTAVEIFNITHLFLSCQSARNWNTISISSLVFLFFGLSRYSPSIHCTALILVRFIFSYSNYDSEILTG